MRRLITHVTAEKMSFLGETNNKESLTMPDQAVSPQELLRKYASGQPLGFKNVTPIYDDDHDMEIPEFYKMDKLDRLHHLQNNHDVVIEKKDIVNEELRKQYKNKKEKEAETVKVSPENVKVSNETQNKADSEQSGSEAK